MATLVENDDIRIVRYNDDQFNISIIDKEDDTEILIIEDNVRFLLKTLIDLLLDT